MGLPNVCRAYVAAAAAGISLALLLPAQAQFWDWGNRPQRQQQYNNNNWGGWGGGWGNDRRYYDPYRQQEREAPVDYSHAPAQRRRSPKPRPHRGVGDANADWLAYGLEDTFAEKPEIGIVRKHRTDSGLIRYGRRATSNGRRWRARSSRPRNLIHHHDDREQRPPDLSAKKPRRWSRPGAESPIWPTTPAPPAATPTPAPPPDPESSSPNTSAAAANMTPEQARQAATGRGNSTLRSGSSPISGASTPLLLRSRAPACR